MKPILSVYRAVERLTVRKSEVVISTGPALEEQARAMVSGSVAEHKFHMIPDTPSSVVEADASHIADIRAKLGAEGDEVFITYAGSFASYQGIDIIFDAMPTIVSNNAKARFVIIGGSDQEIAAYKKQLADKGVVEQVQFLGKINPDLLPAYLAASDILLAPRKSGVNSPLKILDYFKAGAAIVATDTVANKRLLNDGNSVLCEFNVEHFSKAISGLIDSPKQRKILGENAYKLYQSKYNFNVFKQQLSVAYDAVFAG